MSKAIADKSSIRFGSETYLNFRDKESGTFSKCRIWVERDNFYGAQPKLKRRRKKQDSAAVIAGAPSSFTPFLLIGFDTEFKGPGWVLEKSELEEFGKNTLLSYQVHCKLYDPSQPNAVEWNAICYPHEGNGRLSLSELVMLAIWKGIQSGAVTIIPSNVYLAGHFTRADIPAFSDFKAMQEYIAAVGKTFISTESHIPIEFRFTDGETVDIKVHIRDTMLLTPTSSKSLKAIGEIVGVKKIELDEDPIKNQFYKENMDILLKDNPELFENYAINDAEICVKYIDKLIELYRTLLDKTKIPVTLTSIGIDLLWKTWVEKLEVDPLYMVGKEEVEEKTFCKKLGYYKKSKESVDFKDLHLHMTIATECFHGGRNEQYWFGPAFEDDWTDYDLVGAYPTAMALIGMPVWEDTHATVNPDDFTETTLGVCCVDFEFDQSIRFPTLPVRTENGLVFPRKGTSDCAAPEFALARQLGAKLHIRHGVVVPTDDSFKVFHLFIQQCMENRLKFPKNSLENLFWKEISNSSYGKTAQGLREKRVYDLRDRSTKPLPPSRITNAFYASYITSFVRAGLGEVMNSLPPDICVFSCTTDGFLTNAKQRDIEAASKGPLLALFKQSRFSLTGKADALEVKHKIRKPLGWRTRGQATLIPGLQNENEDSNYVLAKGGIYLPDGMIEKRQQNKYICDLFFNRTPEQRISTKIFTGIRDMVERDTDLVQKAWKKKLNMEYDWKRCPYAVKQSTNPTHVVFSTRPWDSVNEFRQIRDYWETYTDQKLRCIRTSDEFQHFATYVLCKSSLGTEQSKYLSNEAPDLNRLRKCLGSGWRHSKAGLVWQQNDISNNEFAAILTKCGIPCVRADIENDSKKEFKFHNCPPSGGVVAALERLTKEFPDLVMDDLLVQSDTKIDLAVALSTECPHLARVS